MDTTLISILTVSQLNREVKNYLENELGSIHVEGEISNLSKPVSGHFYFSLKDKTAQIRCVYFKNRHLAIANQLSDGQHIIAHGRLSLYEARGDYQLIVEDLLKAGLGLLYQQFEELKNKLSSEGLFDVTKKKPIPYMPNTIGVITSITGAAIRDILSTLERRFPLAMVLVYPSEVQGLGASQNLIHALKRANHEKRCDVLLLARGGGSMEDLWAFNDEQLVREIANSTIPIVSGIGHETDFTLADFVADLRAETPTAAATAVTPDSHELVKLLNVLQSRLYDALLRIFQNYQLRLKHLINRISSPQKTIGSYWQTTDYLQQRLLACINSTLSQKKHRLNLSISNLNANNPAVQVRESNIRLQQIKDQLIQLIERTLQQFKFKLGGLLSTLNAVSPLATLERGYAIVTQHDKILFSSKQLLVGTSIEIRLAKGKIIGEVTEIKE